METIQIKFVKAFGDFKVGQIASPDKAEDYVKLGYAELVSDDGGIETALKQLDEKINAAAEKAATEAATKVIDKIAKGVTQRPRIVVGNDNLADDPTGGFKNFGEFASEVCKMSRNMPTSQKFQNYVKVTNANTEASAPNAGPTVPVQYTSNIFHPVDGVNIPDFFGMSFLVPMSSNSVKIPVLKNYDRSNTNAANGVVVQKPSTQATAFTFSESNWEQISLTLQTLAIGVPVSNELLEDNIIALDSVLAQHSSYQIRKYLNGGVIKGNTGFTGIIGHASSVNVATSTSAATGIALVDVLAMYSRFAHDDSDFGSACWFVHPTLLPYLGAINFGTGFSAYFPPGALGATSQTFGTLLGRPIYVTGFCSPVGTSGDIVLADMKRYAGGTKGGIVSAFSIHLYFDSNASAFRYTLRATGQPGLSGPITLEDGSTVVSPFVTLANRS